MKPPFVHLSPTVLASFAAAISISLSLFLLPGAAVQGEPIPLLPAIGGAAGSVAAHLETPARKHHSPRARAGSSVQVIAAAAVPVRQVAVPRSALHKVHRPHRTHPARTRVVRHAPPAPVRVTTPVTSRQFFNTSKAKGKAAGHRHKPKPAAGVGAAGKGHGKALGHSKDHPRGTPPGQAKKAPKAPMAAPLKSNGGGPPADHGGGNGHKGGKK
jgi:hypothetical protein